MPEAPPEPLLAVEHLGVRFGALPAVRDVGFALNRGTTLAIVGESGSGKSVTCLSLIGLLPASAMVTGTARLEGTDLLSATERELRRVRGRRVGLVYQDPMGALDPMRTIGSQVREPLLLHLGMRRRDANARAAELLGTVGIPSPRQHLRAYPHELSGGMQQRVVIAMAIACEPVLLLADELTTALDVSVQAQILELLTDLTERLHLSLVIVSHDLSVVAGMADRILVMYNGAVVEEGPADRIFAHPEHPYTRGLLASIPDFAEDPDAPLTGIPGHAPGPGEAVMGCSFAPRCPHCFERCTQDEPELTETAGGHRAACWLASPSVRAPAGNP